MRRARLHALAGDPRPQSFGVGKWSRIATYGYKRQRQADGSWSETLFDDAKFSQWLTNFLLMFGGRGRGIGSDWEHQTIYSAANGVAAENPAYFTGLCWVRNGQVVATSRRNPACRRSIRRPRPRDCAPSIRRPAATRRRLGLLRGDHAAR